METSTFSGAEMSAERFPVLSLRPGCVPEDLDGAPERRRPALLVAFAELGVVHRAKPLREVAVVRRARALQGENLKRRRRVHLDDHALAPLPRERVVRVLDADLLQLREQLLRVGLVRRTSCGSPSRPAGPPWRGCVRSFASPSRSGRRAARRRRRRHPAAPPRTPRRPPRCPPRSPRTSWR